MGTAPVTGTRRVARPTYARSTMTMDGQESPDLPAAGQVAERRAAEIRIY